MDIDCIIIDKNSHHSLCSVYHRYLEHNSHRAMAIVLKLTHKNHDLDNMCQAHAARIDHAVCLEIERLTQQV